VISFFTIVTELFELSYRTTNVYSNTDNMSESHPNYREAYFQHPMLTKISGDPTYTSLAKLEREIKANGKSGPPPWRRLPRTPWACQQRPKL
jgi:hypothetical protein